MRKKTCRAIALLLTLLLALGCLPASALDRGRTPPLEVTGEETGDGAAELFTVTTGDYLFENAAVQDGGLYTLIALPADSGLNNTDNPLSAGYLLQSVLAGEALFMGSAVGVRAENAARGSVTFTNVRLRDAVAADYYITGPGLDKPYRDGSNGGATIQGVGIASASADKSATLTLVDAATKYYYTLTAQADPSTGKYRFDNVAPGAYFLRIDKPGYLSILHKNDAQGEGYKILVSGVTGWNTIDISPYRGDVNGDGRRTIADLSALLLYYGAAAADLPEGVYPDLNGDGTVGQSDVSSLTALDDIPVGTGTAASATLMVRDDPVTGISGVSNLHKLTFSVLNGSGATVPAASYTLSFRSDYVRPCNATGGVISPIDGAVNANCLQPAAGFTKDATRWKVAAGVTSLTFQLSAKTPVSIGTAATPVAEFYYIPAAGKTTDDFFAGVFTLDHAAVLLGADNRVLTLADLPADTGFTYPGSDSIKVTSISIRNADTVLSIPASGATTALTLSADGLTGENVEVPNLTGVTWTMSPAPVSDDPNDPPPVPASMDGLVLTDGLLTVSSIAQPGRLSIRASRDGKTSAPITVTLRRADPYADSIRLTRDNHGVVTDTHSVNMGSDATFTYVATVYDQYGYKMDDPQVTWSLAGAPVGVTLTNGVLSIPNTLAADTYPFRVQAVVTSAQGDILAQAASSVTLEVVPVLGSLLISGPQSIQIPAEGEGVQPVAASYRLTALDLLGAPITLQVDPYWSLTHQTDKVVLDSDEQTITVYPGAFANDGGDAGYYVLTATAGEISASLPITLIAPPAEASPAIRAVILSGGQAVDRAQCSVYAGDSDTFPFTAQLLDKAGQPLPDGDQPTFAWTLSPANAKVTVADGTVTVAADLAPGSYSFTLSAKDAATGLQANLPVLITVTPQLKKIVLSGPAQIPVPFRDQTTRLYAAAGYSDASLTDDSHRMDIPGDLTWKIRVKDDASDTAPAGLALGANNGILTVYPSAAAGTYTITAVSESKVVGAMDITLTPAAARQVLRIYRNSAPVSSPDVLNVKEGTQGQLDYTAKYVNLATGGTTDADVTWARGAHSFTVGPTAERGVYSTTVVAVDGEGASAAVESVIQVYPNVVREAVPNYTTIFQGGLVLSFDQPLKIPASGATRVYRGTLNVKTVWGDTIPLKDLGVDYDLDIYSRLTGVTPVFDRATHTLTLTIDPSAISYFSLSAGQMNRQNLIANFSYFPGEEATTYYVPMNLESDPSQLTTGALHVGVKDANTTIINFQSVADTDVIAAAPRNTFSHCYAVQLRDQHGQLITGAKLAQLKEEVTWSLEGAPPNVIDLAEDPATAANFSNSYTDLRRLAISADAPLNTYELTLVATYRTFSYRLPITVTVTEAPPIVVTVDQSPSGALVIPRWYKSYNSATNLNDDVKTVNFTALASSGAGGKGEPLNMADNELVWSLDGAYAGVSLNAATGALLVNRFAQPNVVTVTATFRDRTTRQTLASKSVVLTLARAAGAPTLLTISPSGALSPTKEQLESDTGFVQTYTFVLKDQYDRAITDEAILKDVKWTTYSRSGVNFKDGVLTVKPDAASGSLSITAAYSKPVADTAGNETYVKQTITPTLYMPGSGGGPGLGGGLGGGDEEDETPIPASITIAPEEHIAPTKDELKRTQGFTRQYTFVLLDEDKKPITDSDVRSKVTWTLSPAATGVTLSKTGLLTVTEKAASGTLSITATLPTGAADNTKAITKTIKVTLTMPAADAEPGLVTPEITAKSGVGSVTLTDEQETALASGKGAAAVVAPQTSSNLTGVSVTMTAKTANTIAATNRQSLQVQTNVGTLELSPAALRGAATAGTGNVTVAVAKTASGFQLDVKNGSKVLTALSGDATFTAPVSGATSGSVAVFTGTAGGDDIPIKKSVVVNGQLITPVTGSGQVKLVDRAVKFNDTAKHWASSSIDFASARGLVNGVSTTAPIFDPSGTMTRAMIVTVLHRLEDAPAAAKTTVFRDVPSGLYYSEAVSWANSKAIVQGNGVSYDPNSPITREGLATILYRYANVIGVPTAGRASIAKFPDAAKVSSWAVEPFRWAVSAGLVNGKDGKLDPQGYATRAEVATILERMIRYIAAN